MKIYIIQHNYNGEILAAYLDSDNAVKDMRARIPENYFSLRRITIEDFDDWVENQREKESIESPTWVNHSPYKKISP